LQIATATSFNLTNSYPFHTALLSRWIANPANHPGTTVNVSPSYLTALFVNHVHMGRRS